VSGRWAVLLVLSLSMACGGKLCGESVLAELTEHRGDVQRDEASAVAQWGAVSQGDRFHVGDGLRTGQSGTAELSLAADGTALVEGNTVLRFLDRDPRGRGRRLSLQEGVVRIESGNLELDVHTPRGLARVAEGSSVRIVTDEDDTRFDVLVGRVAIDAAAGTEELSAGQTFRVEQPAAAVASARDGVTLAESTTGPALGAADGSLAGATLAAEARGSSIDLALPEVDAMTLHAPTLPVTFRLERPACSERVATELDGRLVPQEDSGGKLVLRIGSAGVHRLRVRCAKRVVRETALHVQRDAANLELPKSAQRVDVEADGRRYTVRYQNVMPTVNVRWRDARPAKNYTLVLRRGSREQTFRSGKPTRVLSGAELVEGDYDFWFTDTSGQKSSVGALRIEFDNTARSLSLSEPIEGSAASGPQVAVSGVALLRSQVSANGVPLQLDSKGRFHAQVPLSEEKSVLVRANHPAAGVHYYLRRLR
jgi:hypothetical protein